MYHGSDTYHDDMNSTHLVRHRVTSIDIYIYEYMYTCIYIYTYIHIYTYTYIYKYIYTSMYMS